MKSYVLFLTASLLFYISGVIQYLQTIRQWGVFGLFLVVLSLPLLSIEEQRRRKTKGMMISKSKFLTDR